MSSKERYLIWSNEHRAWWKPDHRGYTTVTLNAGVFPKEEADRICANANYAPGICNEVAVLAPPEWATHSFYCKETDAFAKAREVAFALMPHDQFTLAATIAQNIGYDLVPEGEHPDSPHAREAEAKRRMTGAEVVKSFRDLGDAFAKWFDVELITEHPPCKMLAPVSASPEELDRYAASLPTPGSPLVLFPPQEITVTIVDGLRELLVKHCFVNRARPMHASIESDRIQGFLQGLSALINRTLPRWLHMKRRRVYTEIARGPLQASTRPPVEGDIIVCYRGEGGDHYFREATEFEDGRFQPLSQVNPVAHEQSK